MTQPTYPDATSRRMITASTMLGSFLVTLDTTIANVALPHMQGSVSASQEEISWVLTSYIVASAICTPLIGWFATRFGRKQVMVVSALAFTLMSVLCGLSQTLGELVAFRLLQGVAGAALVPLAQSILLDINPPENHSNAMSLWGLSSIMGPIIGPTIGGWLTDNFSWRWVFYINLPLGLLAAFGLLVFLPRRDRAAQVPKFDLFGFGTMGMAIGCLQLLLDRGQTKDWFSSFEICIEATGVVLFGYLSVVHMLTSRKPFIEPALFRDRNFSIGSLLGFLLISAVFSVIALMPPLLEGVMGYPVMLTGEVTAWRGIGMAVCLVTCGKLMAKLDPRITLFTGFVLIAVSMYKFAGISLYMDSWIIISTGFVTGFGTGLVFVPLTTLSFATLPARLRDQGSAMFNLSRNIGQSMGISALQALTIRNASIVHAELSQNIRPDNPAMAVAAPGFDFNLPSDVAQMNAMITRQAQMVAYTDTFWILAILLVASLPLLFLVKPPRASGGKGVQVHLD